MNFFLKLSMLLSLAVTGVSFGMLQTPSTKHQKKKSLDSLIRASQIHQAMITHRPQLPPILQPQEPTILLPSDLVKHHLLIVIPPYIVDNNPNSIHYSKLVSNKNYTNLRSTNKSFYNEMQSNPSGIFRMQEPCLTSLRNNGWRYIAPKPITGNNEHKVSITASRVANQADYVVPTQHNVSDNNQKSCVIL